MLLSGIKNRQQLLESDCLVACAAMVLEYLGIRQSNNWLTKILQTTDIGTPFSNLKNLEKSLGVVVKLNDSDKLATFEPVIESGLPIIVALDSYNGDYWPHDSNHAVVVIGFDDNNAYINNPTVAETEVVEIGTFMLSWSFRNFQYAIISLIEL